MRRAAEGTHKGGGGGDRPRHKRGLLHSALTPAAATGWMQAPEPERSLGAYSQEKRTQQERREELKRGRVAPACVIHLLNEEEAEGPEGVILAQGPC